jgi:high-affinity Fe2+/Pb2+ permease
MNTRKKCRLAIALVILGLVASGMTAFPLLHELNLLARLLTGDSGSLIPDEHTGFTHWILVVREGLEATYSKYPFIAYGTDWLAFGHLVIALFFVLPYRDPIRYRGVLQIGVVSCILVAPAALACGAVRGIPIYWSLIDISFGVFCLIPLLYAIRLSHQIERASL